MEKKGSDNRRKISQLIKEAETQKRGIRAAAITFSAIALIGVGYLGFCAAGNHGKTVSTAVPVTVVEAPSQEKQTEGESRSVSSENANTQELIETSKTEVPMTEMKETKVESVNPAETVLAESAATESGTALAAVENHMVKETQAESESELEKKTELQTTATEAENQDPRMEALKPFKNLGIIVGVNNFLNMRKGPSTDDEIIGKIFLHCGVDVLDETADGWYEISSGGVIGYVAKQYVVTGDEAIRLGMESCTYRAKVISDGVNVRSTPEIPADGSSNIVTEITKDNEYDVLEVNGEWVKVEAYQYVEGYVHNSMVQLGYYLDDAVVFTGFENLSQIRKDIINKAFDYYGGKYVWGGETLGVGVDCSGYTEQIYQLFGIPLSRNSYTQCEQGIVVSKEDARPGDLIFYYGKTPSLVGHVAIYIGSGKIIHAASEDKGIIVSNWNFVPIVIIRNVIGD